MAYLSVPSPRKWILDVFGNFFPDMFLEVSDHLLDQQFSNKNGPQMPKCVFLCSGPYNAMVRDMRGPTTNLLAWRTNALP